MAELYKKEKQGFDQMVYAYRILKGSKFILDYYQKQYPYICVDEAQDTSKIQHMIINLLAGDAGNIFMVGDEDQSIYGFRAAYPDALLNFEKEHPLHSQRKLRQHRTTIVHCALRPVTRIKGSCIFPADVV